MPNYEEMIFDNVGEETAEELDVNAAKVNQAVIWGTDWTTETINMQLIKGNIDLSPNFQRRDAWSNQDKSRLIESLILNIPVPPIILAENKNKRNSYIVIDGKQRLLSISRFYGDEGFAPLKLSGLTVLKELNGLSKEKIPEDRMRDFENQSIRTIIIKNWPDEAFLYTVFLRLNTGSKKLSPQELRQALKPGKFLDYLDDATANSKIMQRMLNNKGADPRMKDIELALRFYLFRYHINSFDGNLKLFLDKTCDEFNKCWGTCSDSIKNDFKELETAIGIAYEIINNDFPFSRFEKGISSHRFNRSIYELFSFYLSNSAIRLAILKNKEEFLKRFIKLNDSPDFIAAISDTTKDPEKIVVRFTMFAELISSFYDGTVPTLSLVNGKIFLMQ